MCVDIQEPDSTCQLVKVGESGVGRRKETHLLDGVLNGSWNLLLSFRTLEFMLFVKEVMINLKIGQDSILCLEDLHLVLLLVAVLVMVVKMRMRMMIC